MKSGETIANNMKAIFYSDQVHDKYKASALELAIRGAYLMNRFDAMDTCSKMIKSVSEENLGLHVSAVIMKNSDTFIENIEASECKCDSIINSISAIQVAQIFNKSNLVTLIKKILFNLFQKYADFLPFVVKKCCKTLKYQTLNPLNKG